MSGDVQPRKRKDKNKKKKEDEVIYTRNEIKEPKEPVTVGVHAGAMGPDDIHLHVHKDHGVGGNWCVKIVFFSLLAILLGIAGLILLENRGVSDVDTPVAESRFQEYFEGWVEDKQETHDEHDHVVETLNNGHDDHDEDDGHDDQEPQDAHSGEDHEDDDHEPQQKHSGEDHEDDDRENEAEEHSSEVQSGDKNNDDDSNEDEGIEADRNETDDSDENEQDTQNSGDGENEENDTEPEDELPELVRSKRSAIFAEAFTHDNDDADDDIINPFNEFHETHQSREKADHDQDDDDEEQHTESSNNGNDEDSNDNIVVDNTPLQDENDDSHENFSDDISPFEEHALNDENVESSFNPKSTSKVPIDLKPEEEEEDDDGSFEDDKFFENDSGEDLHLEKLSKQEEKTEEPEIPQTSSQLPSRSGPQSVNDEIEGEINEARSLLNDNPKAALNRIDALLKKYPKSPELIYWRAFALDRLSEIYKSNQLLDEAIDNYRDVLKYEPDLNDTLLEIVGKKCIERARFRGKIDLAITVHEKLITRFAEKPEFQNQLAVSYLLLDRLADAKTVLQKVLLNWPNNGFALAHYGFVLKLLDKNYADAVLYLKKGIDSGEEGTRDGRFYYHLGDALNKLHRVDEANEIHKQGAELKFFKSEHQRSLYNVDHLKSHPFWTKQETTYETHFDTLERNWNIIRQEGLSILSEKGLFENENEDLKDTGVWKQFYLFMSGRRLNKNCQRTPITCKLLDTFSAAKDCRRGQVKFSVMHPKTHVWPHCGPTNTRLRAHLGLTVPAGTFLRVGDETRSWQEGKFLIFDDSFEHEVWHNGSTVRLVLIVDVWHPDLTPNERTIL